MNAAALGNAVVVLGILGGCVFAILGIFGYLPLRPVDRFGRIKRGDQGAGADPADIDKLVDRLNELTDLFNEHDDRLTALEARPTADQDKVVGMRSRAGASGGKRPAGGGNDQPEGWG